MLVALFAALAVAPSVALAQISSTCQAYSSLCSVDSLTKSQTQTQTLTPTTPAGAVTPAATSASNNQGSLPFTGLDVGLLVIGGAGLLGAGLVVRRVSRRSE
jgi:hypothetical protein